jgi:hypothetical protein
MGSRAGAVQIALRSKPGQCLRDPALFTALRYTYESRFHPGRRTRLRDMPIHLTLLISVNLVLIGLYLHARIKNDLRRVVVVQPAAVILS